LTPGDHMQIFDRWLLKLERMCLSGMDVDDASIGHLRALQLSRLVNISPLLMTTNAVNAVIVATVLLRETGIAIWTWLGAVLLFAAFGFQAAKRFKRRGAPSSVGIRGIRKLTINCLLFGLLWGALPCIVFPETSGFSQALVMTVVSGMLGGGSIALGFVPLAGTVFVAAVLILCSFAIMFLGVTQTIVLAPLMLIYTVVLVRAGNIYGRGFAQSVIDEARMREQAATIGILLKEYEHGGRDWIWQTDSDGQVLRGLEEAAANAETETAEIEAAMAAAVNFKPAQNGILLHGFHDLIILTEAKEIIRNHLVGLGRPDGERYWFRLNGKPNFNDSGQFLGYRGVMSNVTEETKSEQRVHFLAHHDPLTRLVNRSSFLERLEGAIEEHLDGFGSSVVMYIDLDGFKAVNDMHGHPTGDALLVEVALRIRANIENDDIAARLGGDEFALLIPIEHTLEDIKPFARKLVETISRPYLIEGQRCIIGASIGIAAVGKHGETPAALMHAADMALYKAKEAGKGTYMVFDAEMDGLVREERYLEGELRQAIERNQLSLAFQPFFATRGGEIAGFEALVRWNHPVLGSVPPGRFIEIAEKIGIIGEIGDWVLNEACRTAADWPEHLSLAVNVSVPQFHDGRILASLAYALIESGLAPERLEIEITERVFAGRPDDIGNWMKEIKQMGVSISLDDFGTGYSSLLYLLKFPFDKLKIDRSFVTTALENGNARGVFETIAELGRKLGLQTTAEGIETKEQLALIESVGCTFSQGYLLGRPMPAEALALFLLEHGRRELPMLAPPRKVVNG
jgi:diguanylate cyclase (GGDEF)-like protein